MVDKYKLVLLLIAGTIGIGTTTWGLSQMDWPFDSPRVMNSLLLNICYIIFAAIIVEVLAKWRKIDRLTAGLATIGLIAVVTGAVWPLVVNAWFALASYIVGRSILFVLKINNLKVSKLTAFLIGAGVYGTVIGLLAHFPINYPGLYGVLLAAPVVLGWRYVIEVFNSLSKDYLQSSEFKWIDLAIVLVALIHLIVSLMPEVGHDALAMHLFIPGHLASRHEWGFDVTSYVWAVMPMMGDWIYSVVYMFGGETAARFTNVGFIFVIAWLVRDLVFWAGGGERGARLAALLFLATPLVFRETSTLLIESIWTSFLVAGTLSILYLTSSNNEQRTHIPIAGIFLGFALATKAVTFTMLPVLFLFLVFRYRTWLGLNYIHITAYSLVLFLIVGSIPYITAWNISGNPVFPFFNEYFQSPYYPTVNFSGSPKFEKGVSWDTIYRVTFESGKYLEGKPGAAGFQWLLLLLPAITLFVATWHRRGLVLIAIGILAIVLTFHQTAYLRYIFPSFVILSAVIGAALSVLFSYNYPKLNNVIFVTVLVTLCLNIIFFKSATPFGNVNIKALMSNEGRTEYLQRRLPIRNAVKLVNELNVLRSPVAIFPKPFAAGLYANALYPNWYNNKFQSLVRRANDATAISEVLKGYGVKYVILDENRSKLETRTLIKKATDEIANYGSVSVRVLREEYSFNTELLSDTDLSKPDAWRLSKGVERVYGGIVVRVKSSASQVVPVTPKRKYLMTVRAQCKKEQSKGRLQVNWSDVNRKFISTNIRVFDCETSSTEHSMVVISPSNARNATVYAAGHTKSPLVFLKASFKK